MRLVTTLLLVAMLASDANAGPLDWARHHKHFLLMEASNAAALVVAKKGIDHCRRGDVERCFEGYGVANAGFAVDAGFSLIVFPAIAEMAWHGGYTKLGYAVGYTPAAVNVALGVQQYRAYGPEVEKAHAAATRLELP